MQLNWVGDYRNTKLEIVEDIIENQVHVIGFKHSNKETMLKYNLIEFIDHTQNGEETAN